MAGHNDHIASLQLLPHYISLRLWLDTVTVTHSVAKDIYVWINVSVFREYNDARNDVGA